MPMFTPEQYATLAKKLGKADDVAPDDLMAELDKTLTEQDAAVATAGQQITALSDNVATLTRERDDARKAQPAPKPTLLLSDTPSLESPAALSFYGDALAIKQAKAAERIGVPAANDLAKLFRDGTGKPSAIALSDAAGKPLESRMWDVLANVNLPPALGAASPTIVASDRNTTRPGETPAAVGTGEADPRLNEYRGYAGLPPVK